MAYSASQIATFYSNAHAGLAPTAAQQVQFDQLAQLSRTGQITDQQIQFYIANNADADTAVALTSYQFFTGRTPTQAGVAFLVNSATNPTDLNDPYYQSFSLENRYINFAQNLGLIGEGRANFVATYGNLTFAQTVQTAYETIVGSAYATAAGINPAAAIADITSRQGYFQQVAAERFSGQNQDLAVKAAVVGYIMAEALKADVGLYAAGVNNFMFDVIPDGLAQYNNDLVTNYGLQTGGLSPAYKVLTLTSGFDFPGGSGAVTNTQGGAGDDIFIASSSTLTNDAAAGGAGADRLIITNLGAAGYTATPSLTGIETVELASAAGGANTLDLTNSTGVNAIIVRGGATGAGPNDIGAGVTTIANAASGTTVVVDVDDSTATGALTFGLKTDGNADSLAVTLRNTDTGGTASTQGLASLTAAGVETLTITTQRASIANTTVDAADTLRIGTLNAAATTNLVLNGDSAIAIGTVATSTTALASIDASQMTRGVTIGAVAAGLSGAASGVVVTTGSGDDLVAINVTSNNVLAAVNLGAGSDTLVLTGGTSGLTVVDLTAVDQVATVNSAANAALQTGIENVDLRGLTGGATITGTAVGNTIVGTQGNDTITGGGGADIIDVQGGFDTLVMSAASQSGAGISANGALTGVDVITGMGVGDRINLAGLGVAAFNGATATESSAYLSGTSGNVALITGTYANGAFTAGNGPDLLFEYDTNGAAAGGMEAIVLVGSNAVISSVSSDGSGIFTFS